MKNKKWKALRGRRAQAWVLDPTFPNQSIDVIIKVLDCPMVTIYYGTWKHSLTITSPRIYFTLLSRCPSLSRTTHTRQLYNCQNPLLLHFLFRHRFFSPSLSLSLSILFSNPRQKIRAFFCLRISRVFHLRIPRNSEILC